MAESVPIRLSEHRKGTDVTALAPQPVIDSSSAPRAWAHPAELRREICPNRTPNFILRAMRKAAPRLIGRAPSDDALEIRHVIEHASRWQPAPRGVRVRPGLVAGVRGEWIDPKSVPASAVLLYLHGGGYVGGSPSTHRLLVGSLVRRLGISAFVPDYRLAPESPPPAQVDDAFAVYERLVRVNGGENVIISGDSAGGGLAVLTMIRARDMGIDQPKAAALISPWVDLAAPTPAVVAERAGTDAVMRPHQIAAMARLLAGDQLTDPTISPLYADVSGLPPTLIQVGSAELLGPQGERLASAFHDAGVPVSLQVWEQMQHVFHTVWVLPERRSALDAMAGFLENPVLG